jgi:hypothetical protein
MVRWKNEADMVAFTDVSYAVTGDAQLEGGPVAPEEERESEAQLNREVVEGGQLSWRNGAAVVLRSNSVREKGFGSRDRSNGSGGRCSRRQ